MRLVAFACLTAGLLFSIATSTDAIAQKAKPATGAASCNRMACTDTCIKRGGRSQYCASWCDKQISSNSKCK